MVKWKLVYTRQATKDAKKVAIHPPPLQKGERGGFLYSKPPKSPLTPLFQRGGLSDHVHLGGVGERLPKKLAAFGLKEKAMSLLKILERNPYGSPPSFEKLVGDLEGAYSRRINLQHRLVYQVLEANHIVKIIRMWTHYE